MKRIGILTFHRSINYGAFMQSYSLAQQLIKRYGRIVEIIDFEKASKHNAYHTKQGLIHAIIYGREREIMRRRFEEDLRLLPLSEKTLITDNYDEVLRYIEDRYDLVIVGSDAVWAFNKGLGLNNPYWLFGDKLQCYKLSYAASAYTLNQKSLTDEEKAYIANCLKSFIYIGVRDQETNNLVKLCIPDAEVFRNCDPTVLLDKPDKSVADSIRTKFNLNPKKKLVTIMMGVYDPVIYEIIKKMGHRDFEYVYLYSRMKARERYMPWKPKYLYDLSPYEWYHIYKLSYLNLTTFFHGTLLALRSNVPTISFDTTKKIGDGKYVSKIEQVISDLGLISFFNSYQKGIQKEKIFDQIDNILLNHSLIEDAIESSMQVEARKSDSFFKCLDKLR